LYWCFLVFAKYSTVSYLKYGYSPPHLSNEHMKDLAVSFSLIEWYKTVFRWNVIHSKYCWRCTLWRVQVSSN